MAEMKIGFIDWTPDAAKKVLAENNSENRPLAISTVQAYAGIMRSGNWDENALDPIVINKFGVLENGQHRLSAVVMSGRTIRMWTIYNSAPTFGSFDRGKQRSVTDVININGFVGKINTHHTALATYMVRRHGLLRTRNDAFVQEYLVGNEQTIKKVIAFTASNKATQARVNNTQFQSAIYMALRLGYSDDEVKRFTDIVTSGFYDNECESAAVVLRNILINDPRTRLAQFDKKVWTTDIVTCALADFHRGKPRKLVYTDPKDAMYQAVRKLDQGFIDAHTWR